MKHITRTTRRIVAACVLAAVAATSGISAVAAEPWSGSPAATTLAAASESAASPSSVSSAVPLVRPASTLSSMPLRTMDDILSDARSRLRAGEQLQPVPTTYDPRYDSRYNTTCPSLFSIRDQGNCGADWATAVVSAMSDRVCMHSSGDLSPELSTQDVLSCCGWSCGLGCSGGYASAAWNYIHMSGVVSGGEYNTSGINGGCMPYDLPPCNHLGVNGTVQKPCDSIPGQTLTPTCVKQCAIPNMGWEADKYCSHHPTMLPNNASMIAAELFYNGPVTATMDVYQDFPSLHPGAVYPTYNGKARWISALTVKIIGYGIDFPGPYQEAYWIAANSWGNSWGGFCAPPGSDPSTIPTTGGFFKILRGVNQCGIEASVMSALPRPCTVDQENVYIKNRVADKKLAESAVGTSDEQQQQ